MRAVDGRFQGLGLVGIQRTNATPLECASQAVVERRWPGGVPRRLGRKMARSRDTGTDGWGALPALKQLRQIHCYPLESDYAHGLW